MLSKLALCLDLRSTIFHVAPQEHADARNSNPHDTLVIGGDGRKVLFLRKSRR
jgi:hypothetical protein